MTSGPSPSRPTWHRVVAGGIALVVVAGALFASCSSGGSDTTTTTAVDASTTSLDDVTVSGAFGEEPTVIFTPPYGASGETSRVISTGTGPAVEAGQQVTVDFVGIKGTDGSELDNTFGKAPQTFDMGSKTLLPVITDALVGQPVGSRVLVAADATASATASWVLMVIDIKDAVTIPTSASGEPVAPRDDLPTVTVEDGVPTVTKPDGDPPSGLV
ncbi:MAG TPA: FKBP-type peptidyl-prolyl cis-trans isomerase, partial [Acidimicrobiales bacterium]